MVSLLYTIFESLNLILYTLGSLLVGSTIAYVVYRCYFHPVAEYPGPFIASITHLWQNHGPFVRHGPDKLSITAEEVVPLVYQKGGRMMPRTEFYYVYGASMLNVFGMRDENAHSIRRRLVAHSSSITSVKGTEQYLDANIQIMRGKFAKYAD
ncbi:hypothetical protein AB5N19_04713 [Seiridium cardinale]